MGRRLISILFPTTANSGRSGAAGRQPRPQPAGPPHSGGCPVPVPVPIPVQLPVPPPPPESPPSPPAPAGRQHGAGGPPPPVNGPRSPQPTAAEERGEATAPPGAPGRLTHPPVSPCLLPELLEELVLVGEPGAGGG